MKTVYRQTKSGWVRVRRCQSFEHACQVCRDLSRRFAGQYFCVNS